MEFNEAFDSTPTNLTGAEMRIKGSAQSKRGYIYGSSSNKKGTFRSTAQSRRENLKNVSADNVMPSVKEAFDYVVALTNEVSTSLGSRMRSQLNTALRIANQQVEQEKKKQQK